VPSQCLHVFSTSKINKPQGSQKALNKYKQKKYAVCAEHADVYEQENDMQYALT